MSTSVFSIPEKIKKRQQKYLAFYDREKVNAMREHIYKLLTEVYFRAALIGFEEQPQRNQTHHPLIYASNHSGMCFPWDAMVLGAMLLKTFGEKMNLRALSAPMLSQTQLMSPYMTPHFWKRMGGVDATYANFEAMMYDQESDLLYYPEGVPGIAKGFDKKYQLQPFAASFVHMSLKYRTDIQPVYTVNAEYLNPYAYSFKWINRLSSKVGIPFLPIGFFLLVIPFQPWIFYFGLPAKLKYVRGERISPWSWGDKPYEALSRQEIAEIKQKIQALMQTGLAQAVKQHGKQPYRWRELWQRMWQYRKHFPFYLPIFWPLMFLEYQRLERKGGKPTSQTFTAKRIPVMLLRNPLYLCYFIPIVGWVPLLIKGYSAHRLQKQKGLI